MAKKKNLTTDVMDDVAARLRNMPGFQGLNDDQIREIVQRGHGANPNMGGGPVKANVASAGRARTARTRSDTDTRRIRRGKSPGDR